MFLDFSGQNISADKIFGGQNFRQQVWFSALLSAEILSNKVNFKTIFPGMKFSVISEFQNFAIFLYSSLNLFWIVLIFCRVHLIKWDLFWASLTLMWDFLIERKSFAWLSFWLHIHLLHPQNQVYIHTLSHTHTLY